MYVYILFIVTRDYVMCFSQLINIQNLDGTQFFYYF